jgi:hypothetical protein
MDVSRQGLLKTVRTLVLTVKDLRGRHQGSPFSPLTHKISGRSILRATNHGNTEYGSAQPFATLNAE